MPNPDLKQATLTAETITLEEDTTHMEAQDIQIILLEPHK